MISIPKNKVFWIIILILLSVPSILPLFHKGFFVTDDGEWMIIRLGAFFQSLRDGQFPVRFLGTLNHDYGYPVANFLYPGYLYIGSFIHILGFGFINCIKIIIGLSLILSSLFTYLWLRKYFSSIASLLGALVYLYTPYHLFDTYVRGSIGEILVLAQIPLMLWFIERKSVTGSSVVYMMITLSHNSLAFIFSPLLLLYTFVRNKQLLISFILGLGLSSFFWLPATVERVYVIFDQVHLSKWWDYFLYDYKLLGISAILIIISFVVLEIKQKTKNILAALFIFGAIIGIYLTLPISSYFWKFDIINRLIQFPWRFLSLLMPSLAFGMCWVITKLPKRIAIILAIFILVSLYIDSYKFISSIHFIDKSENYYQTNDATTTVGDEYMPKWVITKAKNRPLQKVEIVGEGTINNLSSFPNRIRFTVNASQHAIIRINTVYYPGWEVQIDGRKTAIDYSNLQGIITFFTPTGTHNIAVIFKETLVRKISNILSLIFICILLIIFYTQISSHKNNE